jgi:hypothetical protein
MDWLLRWVHLAVLWSFAFAQPLFGVLTDSPEFFVARGNTTGNILLLALGLVLIPPSVMVLMELALAPLPAVGRVVHLVFVGGLVAAIAMQAFKDVSYGPGIPLTLLAGAIGAGAAFLYARAQPVRSVITVLAPLPVLFLGMFLFTSPVSDLFASDEDVPVRQDVQATAPVVLVVFDELSAELLMDAGGQIDAERFPSFAALAREGTWYRNATTISDHTTDAVPGILSGRYPDEDSLPTASDNPRNLFTLLGGAYSLHNVTEPATDLCPSRLCSGQTRPPRYDRLEALGKDISIVALHRVLPNRLAGELPEVTRGFGNFAGQGRDDAAGASKGGDVEVPALAFEDRPRQFERFIERIDADRPDSFSFLHVLLPHTAWEYLPTGQRYPAPPGGEVPGVDDNGVWTPEPALPQLGLQRSALQLGYVDRLVGRLVARLRSEGLYDRTLLILAADHGISFRPGASRRTAEGPAAADVLGVPLFVKAPRQSEGGTDDRHATTADVLPTVADAIGADLGWETDGRSLLGEPRPEAEPVSVSVFPDRRRVDLPFADFVRARDDQARAMRFRQGPGSGWASIYAIGADADLFGRHVADLRSGPPASIRASLDRPQAYESVDPDGNEVPAYVGGRLSAPLGDARLALVVNGVVRGTASAYSGGTRFGGFVAPSAFRAGSNDVHVYAITGSGEARAATILTPRDG